MTRPFLFSAFSPRNILSFCAIIMPWAWAVCFLGIGIGTIWGLLYAPPDYQQGDVFRIIYVHVPSSWWALGIYIISALFSAIGLMARTPLCFLVAKALMPIGMGFTIISLITGSIWGKPTWGAWWVWDARLTSMLVLLFLYIGYLNLSHKGHNERLLSAASIFLILGSVNIPIIKWSVDWWYTLHQPASFMRLSKPAIHNSMMMPLLLMALGFGAYALGLGCWHLKILIRERQRHKEILEG